MLLAAVGAIAVILTQVLPQFVPLFAEAGSALPTSTRLLLAAGDFVGSYGLLLLLGLAGLVAVIQAARRNTGVATLIDRLRLNMPLFGSVHREILAGRFTRTLGTLLANGVPLITALRITRPVVQNRVAMRMVEAATEASTRGAGLSGTIAAAGIFPLRTGQLLRLGEENGELGAMALRAADIHEERARQMMQRRLAMLVPGITIALGGVIAGIVAALLNAMLSLNDLVG
ncbi:MAG: type II secretion system F family protein [Alphaproteobacteria bacterium]|nr:type II secretion system F family protein [Alphaproteobacteria bacterium]